MRPVQKIIIIALCILSTSVAYARYPSRDKTDSLKMLLPVIHDSARVDRLNELSDQYILSSNKDSAEYYAITAYDEAKKINYIHGLAESFSHQSRIAKHFDDDFIKSESLARESLIWYGKTSNKKDIEKVFQELWYALFSQSKYDEASFYAEKEYEISRASGNDSAMADNLQNIAVIHFQKGDFDSAFYYAQLAQQVAFSARNTIRLNSILFNFGSLYRAIEDNPTALNYYRQAFQEDNPETIKYRTDNDWDIWARMEYAELFSLNHQFDSAWHYYNLFDTSELKIKDLRIYLVSTGETYFLKKTIPGPYKILLGD